VRLFTRARRAKILQTSYPKIAAAIERPCRLLRLRARSMAGGHRRQAGRASVDLRPPSAPPKKDDHAAVPSAPSKCDTELDCEDPSVADGFERRRCV